MDLSKLNSKSDAVYFSFLGMFTVSYASYVSYVLGAILAILMIATVVMNVKKRAFKFSLLAKGIVVQVLSLLAVFASMFVLYFTLGIILTGLGLFTIQSLISYVYSNSGVIIGFMLFGLALLSVFYNLIRKMFASSSPVTSINIVRAGAFLYSLVALVLSFACPSLAYMFVIPAILFMGLMLTLVILKKEEKGNYETMLFYLIPFAFSLTLAVPVVAILTLTFPLVLMPVMILPLLLSLMVVAPYMLMLIKILNTLFKKLPLRTIRVQRTVTEQIEDKAKPGKFTTVTSKKITKEKIEWRYRNGAGMSAIALISAIIIMISCAFSVPFGANVYAVDNKNGMNQYTSSLYQDSFILSWNSNGLENENPTSELQIFDKAVYKYLGRVLNGYSWDMDKNAYTKQLDYNFVSEPNIVSSGLNITVTPAKFQGFKGIVELSFFDTANVKNILVVDSNGETLHKIPNLDSNTMRVRFPLDDATNSVIELRLEFKGNPNNINMNLMQYIWDYTSGSTLGKTGNSVINGDLKAISDYLAETDYIIQGSMRYGIIYNYNRTVTLSAV